MCWLSSSHGVEGVYVFFEAQAAVLSHAGSEARLMSENSLTCQVDKQLTSICSQARKVKLSSPWTELLGSISTKEI